MATDPRRFPVELKIQELQRKFRVLEHDTKAYSDEAQARIRRQRATIDKLSRENGKLKHELQETCDAVSSQQHTLMGSKMQALNEQCQNLIQYMEDEKRKERDLLSKISLIEGRVMKCRERMGTMGGVYCAMVSSESIAKQIRILENRLNKGMQKYSEAVAYNKKLKDEINNLRRERVAFDNLYRKMERDLHEKKKSMAEVIDMANAAYKVRDEAHQQVAELKAQAGKEHKDFEKERSELSRLIEAYQKQKQLKQVKQYDQSSKKRINPSTGGESPSRLHDAWNGGGDSATSDETAAHIATYKAAFAKIQEATGMPSIDQLLEAFVNAEEQNFSLYNYVNALSADVEAAEANIVQLQREIDNFQSSNAVTDKRKQEVLQELEAYCTSLEKKTKMFEAKNEGISKTLSELKLGIQRIFDKLECHELYSEELWINQGLNDSTVVSFLQAIEQRTDIIIEFYLREVAHVHSPVARTAADRALAYSTTAPSIGCPPQIKLPSTLDGVSSEHSDDEDSDTRPLSRDELKDRFLKGRNKKDDRKKNKQKKPGPR
ncbi:putative outer dynein arm docking complex protein ODA1 [Toxoplasma gondii RUB]|uniref:Putative outer dynein arm docking complex protein ODA1 n=3 Tax=Toxoplasma gondii TaxID=5811 RepID=A0A086LXU7_TOXGO|nr:putative outer dynein arm docking complex protein ODA1 [Toxoplasma gondii RUB]KFH16802.1 putative outer dynein arm docking complex protein ODA1 [Toxoplasma gondii MAS]RQX75125.1 putative outer dynein arm docking complex protein ODA1 [Toxoplasma gondii CAST]